MANSRFTASILLVFALLFADQSALGQGTLQVGMPVERAIAPGQRHTYTINLERDQLLHLVVQQNGIDLELKSFAPDGVRLADFDSVNGPAGQENITIVADSSGSYRFDVLPLDAFKNPAPGQYAIGIVEIRNATDLELKEGKTRELLKAKGLALLDEVTDLLQEVRNPQTRAGLQVRSAGLLWSIDDRRALRLMEQAMESLREFFSAIYNNPAVDFQDLRLALDLRRQIIQSLLPHDPESSLAFIRSTRGLLGTENIEENTRRDRDLELTAANYIAPNNPRLAFEIARDVLKEGTPQALIDTVRLLQPRSPELAANLAHDILVNLGNQRLLADVGTANLAMSLVQMARPAGRSAPAAAKSAPVPLISDADLRNFYQKMVSEVLSYSPPNTAYTAERNAAQNLAATIIQMPEALQTLPSDRASALTKKLAQLSVAGPVVDRRGSLDINSVPIETGLVLANQAPPEMRDLLYQQVANKAATAGDVDRARQILNEHLQNPARQRALSSLQRQAAFTAAANGRFQDALRDIENERSYDKRISLLSDIVRQIGPGLKKSTASAFLEQARGMLNSSPRADGQEEMKTLLAIAGAFSSANPNRGFQIVEPLIDQFNELTASALSMNGFREKYYRDGELITDNGNSLGEIADQLAKALSNLAVNDIQQATAAARRIRPVSIRIETYLDIAEKAIHPMN